MDSAERAGYNKSQYLIGFVLLAVAVLLAATAYFGANSAKETVGKLDSALDKVGTSMPDAGIKEALPSVMNESQPVQEQGTLPASGSAAGTEAQQPAAADKEVVIDFLYADWCGHCQTMKPIVSRLEEMFPEDRFEVRYWNEASRGSDAKTAAVYADYSAKGYFQGFPTFVANWEDQRVGAMPEATFKAWVCSKFSSPKPTGC